MWTSGNSGFGLLDLLGVETFGHSRSNGSRPFGSKRFGSIFWSIFSTPSGQYYDNYFRCPNYFYFLPFMV